MSVVSQFRELRPDSRNAFVSALLGWTMDAFDYFIVVLVYADIAKDFGVSLTRDGVPDHGHAAHAAGRRAAVRRLGRPRRAADAADRRRRLLLDRRLRLRVRAQLHRAAGAAAALRHRHGRRVGPRRGAGDGEDARRRSAASSPASCSRATRSATCSPPSSSWSIGNSTSASPSWRGLFALQHPAGAALAVRAAAGRGVRGVGGARASGSRSTTTSARRSSRSRRCCAGSST